jgi:glycosyltransferase involved in cell wall biosynthesis
MPAYNEEKQIGGVLAGVPAYVDRVLVVDDGSTDGTSDVVRAAAVDDPRIEMHTFEKNQGVGAALATAYIWARDHEIDVAVTVDSDGQMAWSDLDHLVGPIVEGRADVTKGNRLLSPRDWPLIPKARLLGNTILSLLTKIASGYWSVADSQCGYIACSRYALNNIEWERLYRSYGRENDVLVRANVAGCRVADIPVRPLYGVGEQSTMKGVRVFLRIAFLLLRRFWWRLFNKYVLRDFHPLVFFYLLAMVTAVLDVAGIVYLIAVYIDTGLIRPTATIIVTLLTITTLNSLFFAFWMDMQVNAPLAVRVPEFFEIRTQITKESGRTDRRHSAPGEHEGSAV